MNRIILDTAEYGCYLFVYACKPLLSDFFKNVNKNLIWGKITELNQIDNK